MGKLVDVYLRKIFSVCLLFNALLTVVFAIGLLASYYTLFPNWTPYPPYIFDGRLFWVLIVAAIFNIFPIVNIGKVHTGRLWFHHYVYGFIVVGLAIVSSAFFLPGGLSSLLIIYTTDLGVGAARLFIVGGVALVLDDLADVSEDLHAGLKFVKLRAQQNGKVFHAFQWMMAFVTLYFLAAITIYLAGHPVEITLANSILLGTLVITVITSFANVTRKAWLKVGFESKVRSHK